MTANSAVSAGIAQYQRKAVADMTRFDRQNLVAECTRHQRQPATPDAD